MTNEKVGQKIPEIFSKTKYDSQWDAAMNWKMLKIKSFLDIGLVMLLITIVVLLAVREENLDDILYFLFHYSLVLFVLINIIGSAVGYWKGEPLYLLVQQGTIWLMLISLLMDGMTDGSQQGKLLGLRKTRSKENSAYTENLT